MATTTHYFTGTCKWAKVYVPDDRFPPPRYRVPLCLDADSRGRYNALGLQMRPKIDSEGDELITFTRPVSRTFAGQERHFGPPKVIDSSGSLVRDQLIGNGSNVTLEVTVYDYVFNGRSGKGHRLETVKINNLVEYEREDPAVQSNTTSFMSPSNGKPFPDF